MHAQMRGLSSHFAGLEEASAVAGGVAHEREDVLRTLGLLPAHVENLPSAAGEAVIAILVALLGITAEVELPAVRLDAEPDGREGQVEDAGQARRWRRGHDADERAVAGPPTVGTPRPASRTTSRARRDRARRCRAGAAASWCRPAPVGGAVRRSGGASAGSYPARRASSNARSTIAGSTTVPSREGSSETGDRDAPDPVDPRVTAPGHGARRSAAARARDPVRRRGEADEGAAAL